MARRHRSAWIPAFVAAALDWIANRLSSGAGTGLSISIVLVVVVGGIAVARPDSPPEVPTPEPVPAPTPPAEAPWERDSSGVVTPAKGTDSQGRKIGVSIRVLNDNYRWLLGRTDVIQLSEADTLPVEAVMSLFGREMNDPVIVVGMASHENARENPAAEDSRGMSRADQLAVAAAVRFSRGNEIMKVNLGAYTGVKVPGASSGPERRVLLFRVTCSDPGVDISEAVLDAWISKSDSLEVNPLTYRNRLPADFRVTISRSAADSVPSPSVCNPADFT